jgi:ankyrin repeat protein
LFCLSVADFCFASACFNGHVECARVLLERGASVSATDRYGSNAMHKCGFSGSSPECLELLLEHDADPAVFDAAGHTPLHLAAHK